MKIYVKNNDVIKAYKILTKKVNDEGVLKTLKSREFYLSKSQRVRAKKKIALSRWKKDQKKKKMLEARQEQNFLLYSKKSGNYSNNRKHS